ncbi:hypothetical protein EJ04DRAFT_214006 [Polyplosphaeria fusca]|uniref:RhoGAP-domain-containing protein n=1 Tax=Polyplosphaeria fusca TaxID=682080 RepID=A0A9P4RBW2_9PLEO|nr:hypothetical protein EJ04DRAFT_214006 [Polyplosphaeria fusca]
MNSLSTSPPLHPPPSPSLVENIRSLRETARNPPSTSNPSPADHPSSRRRKPAPSPLQHSSQNPSALPRSPQSPPPPYYDGPRSPREKLDALLAEEEAHPSATPTPTQTSPPTPPSNSQKNPIPPGKLSSYAQLRNVSAPLFSSAGISPPSSPGTMPPPSRPHRPDTRPTAPRNPSIDSAVSSLSSNSQSYRSNPGHTPKQSQDAGFSNPPDMATLIATAGSPEAALMAMWKEKQSAANHNAQLWRLVEKQRTMIIGLNKDLERALKDKERYRKKLKDYANQVPPLPNAPKRSDTFDSVVEREESQSPALSEKHEEYAKANTGHRPGEHKVSPLAQGTAAGHMIPDSQLAQSPSHSSEAPTASNPSSLMNSPTDYSVKPLNVSHKGLGLNAIVNENVPHVEASQPQPTDDGSRKGSNASSRSTDSTAPALALTKATPVIGGDGFETPQPGKPSHPLRKAPPAPLNLSKPGKPSAHLHQSAPGEHSDSDYDDTLEVDEIPIVDRGRRKTREEDDRVREAMMMKEDEARSRSKKQASEGKGKAKTRADDTVEEELKSAAAPLSPRSFSPTQVGLPMSPRHPPANSLNALLSPTTSESSTLAQRSIGSPPLMSPGLPTSPRPGDRPIGSPLPRNPRQSLASPPMSPRSGTNGVSQPAPRAPRQPIPLPPNTPQSYTSPQVMRAEPAAQPKQQPQASDLLKPPNAQPSPESDMAGQGQSEPPSPEHVYRGLVSDQYPGLLLPPNALPSIDVKVFSSRLRPSRLSFLAPKPQEEDPVFILAIYARSDGKQLWRVEKTIHSLPALDAQLKASCEFHGKLPDRALFSGHAPAKIDARRAALNHYFGDMLDTPMTEKAALVVCEFFSTDVIGAHADDVLAPEPAAAAAVPTSSVPKSRHRKEGYLTKRGKNFGGWKARHFVLEGPEFRYYESVGGAHLGTIKLFNAQIGKQSQQQSNQSPQRKDDSEDNQYRHAFLILEPKRKDSSSLVRHVLCAESDEERDAWVEALLQHVDWHEESSPTDAQPGSARDKSFPKDHRQESSRSRRKPSPETEKPDRLQGLSYDDTVAAEAPVRGPTHREARDTHAHSPKTGSFEGQQPSISGPTNGAPIQDAGMWGNKTLTAPMSVKDKKRSIFGFRGRGSSDLAPSHSVQQQPQERMIQQNRNIFGIPLQEAVEFSRPIGTKTHLPSVVYRCLQYLRAKNAHQEEGIFRLSGSNIVIKGLRDRFNNEGDVNLLDGQYYDVHAVASLLKLYLRELPSSVLTRDFHLDFLKVLDMDEREKKIQTFNVLVHKLPQANFELLRHVSSFLIDIIENASVNKMTVRNVGIVFAPTLNIPAPLISMFLTDYEQIFGVPLDEANSPIREIQVSTPPLGSDAIRSPRHQMFSDIPTPAYNETSFQPLQAPPSFPMGNAPRPVSQAPQAQPHYAGYDTGFIPVRPSYEPPGYEQQYVGGGGGGFGSLNGALQPPDDRDARQRRRESGMLLMNMNMGMGAPRKGSNPRIREEARARQNHDPRIVGEETAFD